jgi:Tfp pilus assembly protein PilF
MPRSTLTLLALALLAMACDPPAKKDAPTQTNGTTAAPAAGSTGATAAQATAAGVPTSLSAPSGPAQDTDAGKELAALLERKKWLEERIAAEGHKAWRDDQELAQNAMKRASLLGDWSLYTEAEEALEGSFAKAAKKGGPHEVRASLELTLHRLEPAEASARAILGGVIVQAESRSRAEQILGSVALQRGDLTAAREHFNTAHQVAPSSGTLLLLSDLVFKTGQADKARALIDEALTKTSARNPFEQATVLLRRGIIELETNHIDEARAYFEKANAAYSGWYLIEEHLAEVTALQGKNDEARAMYADIVRRTQRGEFMSALADVLEEAGEADEAKAWRDLAARAFARDMKAYPQAAWGHALDFFLEHDTPERALEIASENARARPWCEAKLGLAEALALSEKLDEAQALVDGCLASDWETPGLRVTAAHVYKAKGDLETARAHAARAEELAKGSAAELGLSE